MDNKLILTFMSGSRDGEEVQIEIFGSPPSAIIGRTSPSQLVIPDDPEMSRRHARIFWGGVSWILEDLGSSNGTFIGEFSATKKISEPTQVKEGEIFRVGLTRLLLGGSGSNKLLTARACAVANGRPLQ